MAGRQLTGDGLSANLAGMSKSQLYDIMSQMKTLVEQNQQQARQILIQNPLLTKALFQAQIMLGMVQPPQTVPNIQPPPSQHSLQSTQHSQQSTIQAAQSLSGPVVKDQTGPNQLKTPSRMQHPHQPPIPTTTVIPGVNTQSQPLHHSQISQQPKGHLNPQVTQASLSQPSHIPNTPALPHHPSQPTPLHQPQIPTGPLQQTTGVHHMPLQPPLPPQPRPPPMGSFQHQFPPPQMGANMSYQHGGAQQHHSQPTFHPSNKPPNMGPSFPHSQLPPNQPPPQSVYQSGGMPLGTEFHNQPGSSMQVDRGSSWMSAPSENQALMQLSVPPSLVPGQMGPGNQSGRPQSLTPEIEKALLQQVMSLTPEQINHLPPEQRNQVLHLQQFLRQ